MYGSGEQSRDFTYVANVIAANIQAADAGGAAGTVLNIAAGGSETVNTLAETIGALLELPVLREHAPMRPGDVEQSWADISLAREVIGYEPHVAFEEGLRLTIESLTTREG